MRAEPSTTNLHWWPPCHPLKERENNEQEGGYGMTANVAGANIFTMHILQSPCPVLPSIFLHPRRKKRMIFTQETLVFYRACGCREEHTDGTSSVSAGLGPAAHHAQVWARVTQAGQELLRICMGAWRNWGREVITLSTYLFSNQ